MTPGAADMSRLRILSLVLLLFNVLDGFGVNLMHMVVLLGNVLHVGK